MYLSGSEDEMERLIEPAYRAVNKRVMDVLTDKYSLLSHFQAHRKYLLLGQGDFIHHLMDLLGYISFSPPPPPDVTLSSANDFVFLVKCWKVPQISCTRST